MTGDPLNSPGNFRMMTTNDVSPANKLTKPSPLGHMSSADVRPTSPALSTASYGSNKNEPPKRLRYWLIDMINGSEIPGLRWENAARTVFRIPWKHAGKNNWKEADSKIFMAWAKHRGKYKEGDKIEAATWKTRLRCALNKLSDIKELKELSNLEGSDPYRVYQLLPEPEKPQEGEIWPRNSWGRESPSNPINHSPVYAGDSNDYLPYQQDRRMMISSTVPTRLDNPSQLQHARHSPVDPITPQFGNLTVCDQNVQQLRNCYPTTPTMVDVNPLSEPLNVVQHRSPFSQRSPSTEVYDQNVATSCAQQQPLHGIASPGGIPNVYSGMVDTEMYGMDQGMIDAPNIAHVNELPPPQSAPQHHEMEVYVKYRGYTVLAEHVTEPTGCRLHYGDSGMQLIAVAQYELPNSVFGPDSLRQIRLLDCEPYAVNPKQIALTKHVLSNIKRGLILFYENGCFYAKRLCQSRVFVFGPETIGNTPEKLERNASVKLFDYRKFYQNLQRFANDDTTPPEMEIQASFGQNWSLKTPIGKNLVTLCMVPRTARFLLNKVREKNDNTFPSINDNIQESMGPDSYDRLADQATNKSKTEIIRLTYEYPHISEIFLPQANGCPTPISSRGNAHIQSGAFEEVIIRPAPMADMTDVEMTGFPPIN